MADYGIKVSRPGYDAKTCDPDQLVFSSKYSTLRVKQQGNGTITHSGGRTVTIAHNLGYVPVFLVHAKVDPTMATGFYDADDYFIHPVVPVVTGASHLDRGVFSYADSTNLYIAVGSDFGYNYFHTENDNDDYATEYETVGGYNTGWTNVGYEYPDIFFEGPTNGAFRFKNVTIAKSTTILDASLGFYIEVKAGSQETKATVYGIDVDNVNAFNSTGAFSNPKTTASGNVSSSGLGAGDYWSFGVTSQVQEIINRAGWSSGNSLGIILDDNGTATGADNLVKDLASFGAYSSNSYLRTRLINNLVDYKYTIFYNKME